MLKELKGFYKKHNLFVDLLLIALIVRLVYLNAVTFPVFDESFYVPAARQILETGVDPNIEHPPLAKFILATFIWLFGDHPLSWRLPSVVFGLASIFFLYFLVLELSKNKPLATLSAALLALDPLHILLSRVALLDIFMLALMLGGAYFALKKDFSWAGFLFGLGIASKWPAALGLLAILAFLALQKDKRKKLRPQDAAYLLFIAALTYVLVYTPFIVSQGPVEWASAQLYNIGRSSAILTVSEQSSTALQWLYLQKPVWFTWSEPGFAPPPDMLWLVAFLGGIPALGIVALGNPVFWVPGLLALFWIATQKAKKAYHVRTFALLWFAFTYVPFLLLLRTHTFIYYMLPVLPAYALALSQYLVTKKFAKAYLVLLAASLILFLPLVIGLPAPESYFELLQPLIGVHPPG